MEDLNRLPVYLAIVNDEMFQMMKAHPAYLKAK
jgi:hypothetical protein